MTCDLLFHIYIDSPSTYDGSDRSELENYLSRLYCRKAETVSVHKTLPENIFDIPIVDELIRCYVQFATMIFDESSNLEGKRFLENERLLNDFEDKCLCLSFCYDSFTISK